MRRVCNVENPHGVIPVAGYNRIDIPGYRRYCDIVGYVRHPNVALVIKYVAGKGRAHRICNVDDLNIATGITGYDCICVPGYCSGGDTGKTQIKSPLSIKYAASQSGLCGVGNIDYTHRTFIVGYDRIYMPGYDSGVDANWPHHVKLIFPATRYVASQTWICGVGNIYNIYTVVIIYHGRIVMS